LVCGA